MALRLARRAAPGVARRDAAVLVLTDAAGAATLGDPGAGDVPVQVGVVARDDAVSNAGIVAFDLAADGRSFDVKVAATDRSDAPRELVLLSQGRTVLRQPLALERDASVVLRAPELFLRQGGTWEVRLEPADDFAEDDAARLVLPASRALAVAVVAEKPSPFLVEALRAMPEIVDPARTSLVAPGAPVTDADVVVADGVAAPAGRPSLSFLADGARAADKPLLWSLGSHAVLAGVDLARLRIARAVLLEPAAGEVAIIGSAQGAVALAGGEEAERRVVLGFRPDASTLPLEPAFPLLVRNAIRWLGAVPEPPRYVVAGEPLDDPSGATVPTPPPGGPYAFTTPAGLATVVRWLPPRGFRLTPEAPVSAPSAQDAVAALPDRRGDRDTRERHAGACAALGAAALLLGALFLRGAPGRRRPDRPDLAVSFPAATMTESPAAPALRSP
jgi:hypothetical protein